MGPHLPGSLHRHGHFAPEIIKFDAPRICLRDFENNTEIKSVIRWVYMVQ
jgi:hypothetical protein